MRSAAFLRSALPLLLIACASPKLGIQAVSPAAGASDASPTSEIRVTFTEALDATSVTAETVRLLRESGEPVPAEVTTTEDAAVLRPQGPLTMGERYKVEVSVDVKSVGGQPLAYPYSFSFRVTPSADAVAPTAVTVTPEDGAVGVPTDAELAATFDEQLGWTAMEARIDGRPLKHLTLDGATVRFAHPSRLPLASRVDVSVTASDVAGNTMAAPLTWRFFTRDGSWTGAASLGAAGSAPFEQVRREERWAVGAPSVAGAHGALISREVLGPVTTASIRLREGDAWGEPEPLGLTTRNVLQVQSATAANGDVIAVWTQESTSSGARAAARRYDGLTRTWMTGFRMFEETANGRDPRASIGPNGHAWVQFTVTTGTREVWGKRSSPESGWEAAVKLSQNIPLEESLGYTAAIDGAGNAVLFHQEVDAGNTVLIARTHSASAGLGAPMTISAFPELRLGNLFASFTPSGALHVLWQTGASDSDVSEDTVWYRHRRADGTWDAPEVLIHKNLGGLARFAISSEGEMSVAWISTETGVRLQLARRAVTATSWNRETVPLGEVVPSAAHLGIDGRGNALVTYVDATSSELWSIREIRDLGWQSPVKLPTTGAMDPLRIRLAVFGDGRASLVRAPLAAEPEVLVHELR